ncbi:NADH-quinone oxidoreductase subunit N [Oleiharenicola lentus]|uniref:NADH-quinone oxidoreductase subunit N n=1 Tax=Oleiharenicola lentus TaxID=2508720 RepID=UPI003F6721A5
MMTTEYLKAVAESNQWWAIGPEMILGCAALMLLVMEVVMPKNQHRLIPIFALSAQLAVLASVLLNLDTAWQDQPLFGGLIVLSNVSQVGRVFFLVSSILVTFLAMICLPRSRMPRVEFYHLIMVVTAAMMLLLESNHFVMLFVALETVTIGFYILVSYFRDSALTLEAGLKYLVLGALSSAIMLFGIVLLYGAVGKVVINGVVHTGFEFPIVAEFLANNPDSFLGLAGALLVIGGVAFKIGAFPFHVWIPDVYQGAPTPVTAFLAVSSKAAGFGMLMVLVLAVFAPLQAVLVPVLSLLAGASIIFGNLSALTQRNAKRLMGLSGVTHAGYLLLGVIAALTVDWAAGAVWFYLFTYMLASMAVFGVMAYVAGDNDADQELDHYEGLAKKHPFLGGVLAVGVGSLAGIPPLAGFMGKLLLFVAAFQAHLYCLLAVAIGGVIVSIYYYFGWIKAAYFETWRPTHATTESQPIERVVTKPSLIGAFTLTVLALATVLLGFYQAPLSAWLLR